jgi:hypothetical protein
MGERKRGRGQAIVEFAMVAILLLVMSYPVFDYFRAIQTYLILVNVSREGANLASRMIQTSTQDTENILNGVMATTPPLTMQDDGMIYITKVMGHQVNANDPLSVVPQVQQQFRWQTGWTQSRYLPQTTVWNCGSNGTNWAGDGSCANISSKNPPVANLDMQVTLPDGKTHITLRDGEIVYVVDVFYRMPSLFGFGSSLMTLQVFPDVFQARTIM